MLKNLVLFIVGITLLFGANDSETNQKLNLILQKKMQQLEKKVCSKDKEIENLKKN